MLNALSVHDTERALGVLNSLAAVFGPVEIIGAEVEGTPALDGDVVAREADRLKGALSPLLRNARFDPVDLGDLARMIVPASSLFVGDSVAPLPTSGAAIAALAGVLRTPPSGLVFTVEIVAPDDPRDHGTTDLGIRRAIRLARALVDAGVDPALIGAGTASQPDDDIALAIRWTGSVQGGTP